MPLKIQAEIIPEGDFFVTSAERIKMSNGKSVEEEFAEIAKNGGGRFTGSTGNNTPMEVMEALVAGKNIVMSHTDSTYGIIFFMNFTYSTGADIIAASVTFEYNGVLFNAGLVGKIEAGTWDFSARELAAKGDIPASGVKAVTAVDLTKFESEGIIVETYEDESTNTYTFVDDTENNSTTVTDSNGNSTVITGLNAGYSWAEEASF